MPIKNLLAPKTTWLALAALWTLMIAVLCLVSFDKLPSVANEKGADKIGHLCFHFVFTLLWFGYFYRSIQRPLLKVFLGSLAYGILIEILQGLFTASRKADLNDVAANTSGALIAVLMIALWLRSSQRNPTIKS